MPDVTPSGRGVLVRLAQGRGPGQGMANCTAKLERDGLIVRVREGVGYVWELTRRGEEEARR